MEEAVETPPVLEITKKVAHRAELAAAGVVSSTAALAEAPLKSRLTQETQTPTPAARTVHQTPQVKPVPAPELLKPKPPKSALPKVNTRPSPSVPPLVSKPRLTADLHPDLTIKKETVAGEESVPAPEPDLAQPAFDIELEGAEVLVPEVEAVQKPVSAEWLPQLYKEPSQKYEGFSRALRNFIDITSGDVTSDAADEQLPGIFVSVLESMDGLATPERLQVEPIIAEIVGTIHGIHVLEEREAGTRAEAAREQLENLCIELLETLGVAYDPDDVTALIQGLLSAKFIPVPEMNEAKTVDLEQTGTHEAKYPKHTVAGYFDMENYVQRFLGTLVLLQLGFKASPKAFISIR